MSKDLNDKYILRMENISKRFGEVVALQNADLNLKYNEVLGLVGDNAAGKSTLMKILTGVIRPNDGRIFIENKEAWISNPRDSMMHGIEMIYQDLSLAENIDVAGNIFMGREPTKPIFGISMPILLDRKRMEKEASTILVDLGIRMDSVRTSVDKLSGGQRQSVAISRAIKFQPRILIMDEPTSALGVKEAKRTLELIRELRQSGVSIIIISHRIPDVMSVADRIMVLRRGQVAGVVNIADVTLDDIIRLIVGT